MLVSSVQNIYTDQKKGQNSAQTAFTGAGSAALNGLSKFFQICDDVPMIGVSVTDTCATNVPRTVVDLKQTGVPAATETARREFSGLFVNCLIPGAFVYSWAKLLNNHYMKDFKTSINKPLEMSGSWANSESITNLAGVWKEQLASGTQNNGSGEFIKNALSKIEGLNGVNNWEKLSDNKSILDKVSDILQPVMDNSGSKKGLIEKFKFNKEKKSAVKKAYDILVNGDEVNNGFKASHTLKFDGKPIQADLKNFLRDTLDIGGALKASKEAGINPDEFAKKAAKLASTKSLAGLGVVIPLAMSMQYINRAITRHKYKKSGAPIYKDFEKEQRILSDKEKKTLSVSKPFAVGSIVGLAALSMGKTFPKSPEAFNQMLQFNTKFPTLNQCRVIATGTFASRMLAAEDPNELRESTVRDLASFAGLYFLGDYAEKLAATVIQKFSKKGKSGELQMFNKTRNPDEYTNVWQKFKGWIKDTNIKTFDEIPKEYKNYRSLAKLGGLGFSMLFLGVLLPMYNKHVTNKKEAKRKALLEQQKMNAQPKNNTIKAHWDLYKNNPAFSKVSSQLVFKK